jgi:hypothetical protein
MRVLLAIAMLLASVTSAVAAADDYMPLSCSDPKSHPCYTDEDLCELLKKGDKFRPKNCPPAKKPIKIIIPRSDPRPAHGNIWASSSRHTCHVTVEGESFWDVPAIKAAGRGSVTRPFWRSGLLVPHHHAATINRSIGA